MKALSFDICIKCGLRKPVSDFKKDSRIKRGYSKTCKKCKALYARDWYLKNGKTGSGRFTSNRDGFSHEDYLSMLEEQHGCCAICGGLEPSDYKRRLSVDHDHKTGKIRGLLCMKCNSGLGMFDDSETILLNAIKYLKGN